MNSTNDMASLTLRLPDEIRKTIYEKQLVDPVWEYDDCDPEQWVPVRSMTAGYYRPFIHCTQCTRWGGSDGTPTSEVTRHVMVYDIQPPLLWLIGQPIVDEAMDLYVKTKLAIELDHPDCFEEFKYWIQSLDEDTAAGIRRLHIYLDASAELSQWDPKHGEVAKRMGNRYYSPMVQVRREHLPTFCLKLFSDGAGLAIFSQCLLRVEHTARVHTAMTRWTSLKPRGYIFTGWDLAEVALLLQQLWGTYARDPANNWEATLWSNATEQPHHDYHFAAAWENITENTGSIHPLEVKDKWDTLIAKVSTLAPGSNADDEAGGNALVVGGSAQAVRPAGLRSEYPGEQQVGRDPELDWEWAQIVDRRERGEPDW